ncbi:hypothetical protein TALC_00432 [Thermoplasmatales archaeon BRNA1]|nr:hypothetical protein TALC_00432 [Thermoplasmatales archaeon BRNA1]
MVRDRKRCRRGGLPFSAVAIAMLMVVTAYVVAAACMEDSECSSDGLSDSADALDDAMAAVRADVNAGMGDIVYSASTDFSLGDFESRKAWIEERTESWLEFAFPMVSSGIRAELIEYDVSVGERMLRNGSGPADVGGYTPLYVAVTGTLTARFECPSGVTERTLEIVSDGSCALPLASTQGSLFAAAIDGSGTLLSQMMVHQLTSLAQFRVMNGYGARSAYSPQGTNAILTPQDVELSYRSCLNALKALYIRDPDGSPTGTVSLASLVMGSEVELDLGSVYANALYARADDLVLKWFDYFMGYRVLEICDYVTDRLKDAWDSVTAFVTGRDTMSARPYIEKMLSGEEDLNLRSGETFEYVVDVEGFHRVYTIHYPPVDLMHSQAVSTFVDTYRDDTNFIRQWLTSMVNAAVADVAESHRLPTVTIDTSSGDFSAALGAAAMEAMNGAETEFWNCLTSRVDSGSYPDQFYSAIYDAIYSNRDRIFSYSISTFIINTVGFGFGNRVAQDVLAETGDAALAARVADSVGDNLFRGENAHIYNEYRAYADLLLSQLSVLSEVETSNSSIIEKGCIGILRGGMLTADVLLDVSPEISKVCREFSLNMASSGADGLMEIPIDTAFVFASGDTSVSESLDGNLRSAVTGMVRSPSPKSAHETGFNDSTGASFCTVIPVEAHDELSLMVTGRGSMSEVFGMADSYYRVALPVHLYLEVPVVSGYPLAGVEYGVSTDVLEDAKLALLNHLAPFVDDLRELIGISSAAMSRVAVVMSYLEDYMTEKAREIYEKVILPIQKVAERMKSMLTESFCSITVNLAEGMSAIVDVGAKTQTVGISYMGFDLKFTFYLATLLGSTKHICLISLKGSMSGVDILCTADLKLKSNGDPILIVKFTASSETWTLSGVIDPFLRNSKTYVSLSGTIRGIDFTIAFPTYVEYRNLEFSLQDVPALGTALNNIPFVIPGTKVSLDAGIQVKYDAPIKSGVLINEFEPNPEGDDRDNEWAEIINLSGSPVNLEGWTLTNSSGGKKVLDAVSLAPGERTVVEFSGIFLKNSKERLQLKDAEGAVRDTTDTMTDGRNDGRTCQRFIDGGTSWKSADGTMGAPNTVDILEKNGILMDVVKDIVAESAKKALHDVGKVKDTESLSKLIRLTFQYSIDEGIDQISSCLIEATLYLQVEITDMSSSAHGGFRIYLTAGKDLASDVLKYLVGRAESMLLNIQDPYGIELNIAATDDVFLGVTVYGELTAPSVFKKASGSLVEVGIDVECNLSSIRHLLGSERGTPEVRIGIVCRGMSPAMCSAYVMDDPSKSLDVWVLKMSFRPSQ